MPVVQYEAGTGSLYIMLASRAQLVASAIP
jgi:hypothetical protein